MKPVCWIFGFYNGILKLTFKAFFGLRFGLLKSQCQGYCECYKITKGCEKMEQKKIAIFDHVGKKAGMDYYSGSLAKGLQSQGCEPSVYSNFIGIEPDKIKYKVYYEGHSKSNAFAKLFRLIYATVKASFDARRQKTDLVILHLFSANVVTLFLAVIPKLFGLRTAVISHDVSSFTDNDNKLIQNLIYNTFADFIIVHNLFSHQILLQNIQIKNPEKVAVIKHGGSLDYISMQPEKKQFCCQLGLEENTKYILFFGQIKKVKGLDILLEAMSKVSDDIKLIIAGKPWKDDFSSYDEQIQKLRLQERVIKMIRFIEDEEREKLFFAADVNVLPYRIIYQSGVLLMAMSYGLPVIASDLPANKEIIESGENGLLFKSEDPGALANQINKFFEDGSLQKKISANALNTIQSKYSWNDIGKEYLKLLESR